MAITRFMIGLAFTLAARGAKGWANCANLLDQSASAASREAIAKAFHVSFQMEYRFFDMAWRQEQWDTLVPSRGAPA